MKTNPVLLTGYSCPQVPSAVHTPSTSTVDFNIYNLYKDGERMTKTIELTFHPHKYSRIFQQEKSGFQQEEAAALMVTSASVGPLAPLIYQDSPEMKPSLNQKVESVHRDEA